MRLVKSVLAGLAVFFAMPASATTITVDNISYNYGGAVNGGIFYNGTPAYGPQVGPAGQFIFTGHDSLTSAPFGASTWCIDLFRDAAGPADGAMGADLDFQIVSLSDFFSNATKISQLAGLVSHAASTLAAAGDVDAQRDVAAAFQLAIWEIIYEDGTSGYSISDGVFSTYDNIPTGHQFSQLWGLADGYLGNVETGGIWTTPVSGVSILESVTGRNQSQIFATPTAVPEPGTWLTMILGFGLAGAAMRRARKRDASTALSV